MVLKKNETVTWFTPSSATVVTGAEAASSSSLNRQSSLFCQGNCPNQNEHGKHGTNFQSIKPVTGKKLHQDLSNNSLAISSNHDNNHANPLTVFGPAFEKQVPRTLRRRTQSKGTVQPLLPSRYSRATPHRRQKPLYSNDSILDPSGVRSNNLSIGDWCAGSDQDYSGSSDIEISADDQDTMGGRIAPLSWQDIYYSEMPLELLDNIFQRFLYVSEDSLNRLAVARELIRSRSSKRSSCHAKLPNKRQLPPYLSKAGWRHSDFLDAEATRETLHIRYPHQYHPCLHLSGQPSGVQVQSFTSQSYYHRQQTVRQRLSLSNSTQHEKFSQSSVPSRRCQDDIDDQTERYIDHLVNRNANPDGSARTKVTRGHLFDHPNISDTLGTDRSYNNDGDEYGSTSSGSQEIRFDFNDDIDTGSENSFSDEVEDEDEDETLGEEFNETMCNVNEQLGGEGSHLLIKDSRVGNTNRSSRHANKQSFECNCHSKGRVASVFPRRGINRVDNELEDEMMIYYLHRDQYFHPTTHTSLRSDLYICSLVCRQWRVAALQLLWRSIVLDSESCRIEPSDPCYCCMTYEDYKLTRTRIEAMMDSYIEVYNLDLAKCVQTIEIDLSLITIARATETNAIKRILKRMSPFTHIRLVWTDRGSSENQAAGFEAVFESLHSQIRHLHFLPGFIISKAWVREMEKMTKLEIITLENLGSTDVIEYDWTKIISLRMNGVIPRHIFGLPTHHRSTGIQLQDFASNLQDGASTVATASIQSILSSSTTTVPEPNSTITIAISSLPSSMTGLYHTHELEWEVISPVSSILEYNTRASGWWQWTGLRKIELKIKDAVLPREWLQELVDTIAQTVNKDQQLKKIPSKTSAYHSSHSSSTPIATSFGPPLEILDIDCDISHPHKDIFTQLVQAWGDHFEEFHFRQSDELTDEFFWLCLQKMTRVKKLSLRDSKGITGEGFIYRQDTEMIGSIQDPIASIPDKKGISMSNLSPLTSKTRKLPIMLRHDFSELNLDGSRIRSEFLDTLKHHCPNTWYKVREIRQ